MMNTKRQQPLASNGQYFIYDKRRLATFLVENIPVSRRIQQEVTRIEDLDGFDRIFDCRGTTSVINDPAYMSHVIQPAQTACRYLVLSFPPDLDRNEMRFWSEIFPNGSRRTFFHDTRWRQQSITGVFLFTFKRYFDR
ncbi:hypothetical protein PXH59_17920 [Xenorhabdus sp. SF857]|uniref:hypothetical protein n=1 Tax=Xenorhabdus bakwenae TaxID=3026967 RepID=UPI0025583294|nr:hypothetical protein [Xenorhabdus sp. SF857]WFQ79416.1 hypothetical protein PXH59_17920 [Xenorhabdus sp. SF857]